MGIFNLPNSIEDAVRRAVEESFRNQLLGAFMVPAHLLNQTESSSYTTMRDAEPPRLDYDTLMNAMRKLEKHINKPKPQMLLIAFDDCDDMRETVALLESNGYYESPRRSWRDLWNGINETVLYVPRLSSDPFVMLSRDNSRLDWKRLPEGYGYYSMKPVMRRTEREKQQMIQLVRRNQ